MLLMTICFTLFVTFSLVLSLFSLALIEVLFSSPQNGSKQRTANSATPSPVAFDLELLRRSSRQTVSQSL
ncbi:MAG: hypothetical protein DWQ34_16555 [Planctomycetota bacterium]|nr:MAG: hypothetical protein DWQ29_22735 [Planctomycetota bacterium]REJ90831.1 MAG: hypothetical protein DWQ34_16555 [Planctomycetota bacterium]REK24303.1 MAG: hypothetical protein DWQ41_14840 [Planctomycetota bacterium]REK28714.1 MAG: hypothetical protein DWQ45_23690 [Planctomycetota bacterium]